MKKIVIIALLSFVPFLAIGQVKQINDILDKYEKNKDVESILISPELLQMAGESQMNQPTKDLLSKLTELRILSVKSSHKENGVSVAQLLRQDLDRVISQENMSRILKIRDGEELMEMFKTKEDKGALLFLNSKPGEFTVISIFGKIDPSVVNAAISGEINIK
ncbi:MAG: DUF4252 domain-containing protein [Bacteroidales bacterium]|jgi:hypothetical protein